MSGTVDRFERDRAFLAGYRALPPAQRSALCRLMLKPGPGETPRQRVTQFHVEIGYEPAAALDEADAVLVSSRVLS